MRAEKRKSLAKDDGSKKKKKRVNSLPGRLKQILADISTLKEGGQQLDEMFVELPPQGVYPDYYVIIENRISLAEIRTKVDNEKYNDSSEFVADFELMTKNAQQYNGKHSQIAREAGKIAAFVKKQIDEVKAEDDKEQQQVVPAEDVFRASALSLIDDLVAYRKGGRLLSEIFMVEPDRKIYPDYYKIVKKATSFKTVKKLIDDGTITSLEDLEEETRRIFSNAQLFNEEGSQVYIDSVALEKHLNKGLEKLKRTLASAAANTSSSSTGGLKLKVKMKQPAGGDKHTSHHKLRLSFKPAETDDSSVKQEADDSAEPAASAVDVVASDIQVRLFVCFGCLFFLNFFSATQRYIATKTVLLTID
jgi:chromatin structure-remodeling complex subunit RSC4